MASISCLAVQVYDLEKRQQAAAEREARKAAKQALKERQEREHQAKLKMEEDAYEMQLQVLHHSVPSTSAGAVGMHGLHLCCTDVCVVCQRRQHCDILLLHGCS